MSLSAVTRFLYCATPEAWLSYALDNIPLLLIDHAKCEKKAASTALSLMFRYPERTNLQIKMAQLAREEVLHFEQVFERLQARGIDYDILSPSRYASELRKLMRPAEPYRLVDACLIGAIIEARSCERFAALAPRLESLDAELAKYYQFLLKSESRHFEDYLALAREYSPTPIEPKLDELLSRERELIESEDPLFRFHSGIPSVDAAVN